MTDKHLLEQALAAQRAAYRAAPVPTEAQRRRDLQTLRRFVSEQREAICAAISRDYGHRSRHETELTECMPVLKEIDHALRHLRRWMRVQRRGVDRLAFGLTHRSEIDHELEGTANFTVPSCTE